MGSDEETKQPAKKPQAKARQPDVKFDAEMKDVNRAQEEDDIELEDKFHDVENMESVSVIDHEVEYLTKLAKTTKD